MELRPLHQFASILIPNSHAPFLLNCLRGDDTTSLSRVQVRISPISVVIKKSLPSISALHCSRQGSRHTLPSVKSGPHRAAGLGRLFQAGSTTAQSVFGILQEEASRGQRRVPLPTQSLPSPASYSLPHSLIHSPPF